MQGKNLKILAVIISICFIIIGVFIYLKVEYGEQFSTPTWMMIFFISSFGILISLIASKINPKYDDEFLRDVYSKFDSMENSVYSSIDKKLEQKIKRVVLSEKMNNSLIYKSEDKIEFDDPDLLEKSEVVDDDELDRSYLDEVNFNKELYLQNSLRAQIDDHIFIVSRFLLAPARRAENIAKVAQIAAYIVAFTGVALAIGRLFAPPEVGSGFLELYLVASGQTLWPVYLSKAAPWVGAIVLLEFLAVMFLKQSFQLLQLQHQLSARYVAFQERGIALIMVLEKGKSKNIVSAANVLLSLGRDIAHENINDEASEILEKFNDKLSFIISNLSKFSQPK